MGEISDMKQDGTLCECCGSFIGDEVGYPRYCTIGCLRDVFPKRSDQQHREYLKREKINRHGEGVRKNYKKLKS